MNEERRIENIPIHKIIPNIYQPRIKFDDKSINELSKSIKDHGIIQPLILRKLGNSYEIIDGERRYKAAKKINLQQIPSIILNIDDKEVAELILTENLQKQLLTPIEEANAYQQIMLLNKFNVEELAEKIGKDKKIIENKLKLLTLSSDIQEALLNNKISEGHAKALTKITSRKKQMELYDRVIKERIPVKVLEEIINQEINEKKSNELQKDIINLEDLNKEDFIKEKEENKKEEKTMNNNQLNFNQYNNLLKEQQKPEMVMNEQPQPIIGNNFVEQKQNDFFPSLEEQPLNLEVPVNNQPEFSIPTEMPHFEVPTMGVQEPVQTPMMEAPQMPVMETPMSMPQFEVPTMGVQEPVQAPMSPMMEVPQMPVMETPMSMPQFEVPTMGVQEPVQAPMSPMIEVPQMSAMETPMSMPQFEMPTMNVQEPVQTPMEPMMEAPIEQTTVTTDVTPAVNIIKTLLPLLENSGYRINIEELDNLNEYQIVLKIQK